MIRVESIGKSFGATKALSDLSFTIKPGELVGFVGPNGAGKTTTLRILSGYLLADEGNAWIMDYDVRSSRKEACACIGYMPERTPLPDDMRVTEFLRFRARLKGVSGSALSDRVDSVLEELELVEVRRRLIGRLSRGFRQRVALADALVADPKVLLLDEPSTGLDPVQRRSFRKLLVELSQNRSVLFSSHVLPEVEAVVSRFLVLHRGTLVADGDLQALCASAEMPEGTGIEEVFTALVKSD